MIAEIVLLWTFTMPLDVYGEPTRIDRVEIVHCQNDTCAAKNVYGGPRGYADGPIVLVKSGEVQRFWAVFTESEPVGGVLYAYMMNDSGTGHSNAARFQTYVRIDTPLAVARADSTFLAWAKVTEHAAVGGLASYSHALGDSVPAYFMTQTAIQVKLREWLLKLFGFYGHSGKLWTAAEAETTLRRP